jgi:hypothetical protein
MRPIQHGPVDHRSGVAEAQAIGADGQVALIARVTAYR